MTPAEVNSFLRETDGISFQKPPWKHLRGLF